jgi:hypothetical protein
MFFLGDVTEMMNWKIDAPVEKEEDLGISARREDSEG